MRFDTVIRVQCVEVSYCGYDRAVATVDSLLIVVRCHRDGNWSIHALRLLLGVYCFFKDVCIRCFFLDSILCPCLFGSILT